MVAKCDGGSEGQVIAGKRLTPINWVGESFAFAQAHQEAC